MCTKIGTLAAATVTIAAWLLAACGAQQQAQPGGQAPAGTIASAPTSAVGGCASGQVQVTEQDNGKTMCVTKGATVTVILAGTDVTSTWSPIVADGASVLSRVADLSVPSGVTTASYSASRPGRVHLSSSKPVCPGGAGAGHVRCHAVQGFEVTVTVT